MKETVITITLNPALDKTIVLPILEIGKLNRVKETRIDPGGKGINVAKVLKSFGVEVLATGLIAGNIGQLINNKLRFMNINVNFFQVPGETRTNLKIVDEKTKITTEINEAGFSISPSDIAKFKDQLNKWLNNNLILVIAGSLPSNAPIDIYKELIELANEKGVKTILDADGSALKEGIKAKPFAIKPNIFELEQLAGRKLESDDDILQVGKELIGQGIKLLVVSQGSKGAILMEETEAYKAIPFNIVPANTVGSGDSMVAALVYSLLNKKNLEETAILATTAGTLTAAKAGTQTCTLSEIEQNKHKIKTQKLNY